MKIHMLGTSTSQGVPVIGCSCEVCQSSDPRDSRLRSSVVVEQDGRYLLFDTGPDLRQQMLAGLIPRIDAVFYTHEHNDHVIGLDDIRPYNFKQKEELPLYGLPRVMDEVERRFSYAFGDGGYPGAPRATKHYITGDESLQLVGMEVTPIHIVHGRLAILGYRVGSMAFITDASAIAEREFQKLQNLDVLIINALRMSQHPAHFSLSEALEVIKQVQPRTSYITHVSHYMGKYEDWASQLPADVFGAYDGLVVEI